MADSIKAQKLAAARKKLKEYQQKTQKPGKKENDAVADTLSNSTHSSINGDALDTASAQQSSPFHTYFNSTAPAFQDNNFFDSISAADQTSASISNEQVNINNGSCFKEETSSKASSIKEYFNEICDSTSVITDNVVIEHEENSGDHPAVSQEDANILLEYMGSSQQGSQEKREIILNTQGNPNFIYFQPLEAIENNHLQSDAESLRQMSSQMAELIREIPDPSPQPENVLERRNQELAALLEHQRLESQRLQAGLQEYRNRVAQLESENEQMKVDCEHRLNRGIGPLQEQLQYHAQTLGILVGEKTELCAALSQSQNLCKQKIGECEELQGRLKTSRSRVADLEKELNGLKTEKKAEKNETQEEEVRNLRRECQNLREQKEEADQDLLELREKLNVKVNENLGLQREVQEVSHQLSLAQVKIEQITAGETVQVESQIEILTQQKLSLEKQVQELSQALKSTGEERDQASSQYQIYVQQLNGQVASLANKLESLTAENESLMNREQDLVKHIGELEKHLQNMQEERVNVVTGKNNGDVKKELEEARESLKKIEAQREKLEENYKEILSERDELLHEMVNKKEVIEDLESKIERLQHDKPDTSKLLATMESDKVAAARAVSQNTQLKQELEEMQQAFVKMSNDKLELTDQLDSQEFRMKDLSEKLAQTEHQLKTLTDAIDIKDKELTQMRENLTHQNKQLLQQDQLADRLRHYEAQDSSSHILQVELQKAQDHIQELLDENSKLKISSKPETQENSTKPSVVQAPQENVQRVSTASQTVKEDQEHWDVKILDKEAAMKHLEQKVTRTMQDIANLTEEKQRLEHIVMQLQGETETIGEYIALYQHQRGILRQRTQEKDEQLRRLAEDREKVRVKLDMLNELVKKVVLEKGVLTPEILEEHRTLNNQEFCSEHAKLRQEMHQSLGANGVETENNNLSTEAEKIMTLLADIKSSNLIQPSDGLENFHPCPWCSGKLLTV